MKCLTLCFLSFLLNALSLSKAIEQKDAELSLPMLDMAEIFTEYFKFQGVHSLTIVVCKQNYAEKSSLKRLYHALLKNNFYIRIFSGYDYMSDAELFALRNSSAFKPKSTFRIDNDTRRPLRLQMEASAQKTGVIFMEFHSPCALNVLRWSAAAENNFFLTSRFWLLLTENSDTEDISILEDDSVFLPPDSEVRVLSYTKSANNFNLTDIYKISAIGALKIRNIGLNLNNSQDMILALQQFGSAISYRQNLEGLRFTTGIIIAFPDLFTTIEDMSMPHIDTIPKVHHNLVMELANRLNITFNTYQTDNYGWRQPNGSFDGLMGMFQRSELDFCLQAIFMRLDRIYIVDFVVETFRIRAGIIFRQPPLSAVANIFAMPFDRYVWISILILMIFTIIVFGLEVNYSPHQHEMDFWDCIVFVWGAMCQQGFYVAIGNRSGRIIIFTTFVATLFLFTSFSANIVALLQSPSEAITSLSDLSSSPLEIGVQDTQYNKIFFSESTDPVTNRLYHKKIAPKGDSIFMRPPLGISKMRSGLFAYQVELQAGYQIISETFSEPEKCGLKELEPFQLPILAFPTRKNLPYKELIRRFIRLQREVGLINREELKWIQQKPKCEGGVSGFVSIGLTECRYAIAMYGFGMLFGFIVFWFELILKYFLKYLPKFRKFGELVTTTTTKQG